MCFFSPVQSINVHIDENALHEILNEVDLNKNGQVEIDEFLQVRSTRAERGGRLTLVSINKPLANMDSLIGTWYKVHCIVLFSTYSKHLNSKECLARGHSSMQPGQAVLLRLVSPFKRDRTTTATQPKIGHYK